MDQLPAIDRADGGAQVTRRIILLNLWLAIAGAFGAFDVLASTVQPAYLPLVRQAAQAPGTVYPPGGRKCLLQTGSSAVVDPRTGQWVYSCEMKNSHGFSVFTKDAILLEHVATGSGSLAVIDGAVFAVAVREDGGLQIVFVPTP
jgi:hypothetical protein